jgi:hypothetical protein
MLALLADSHLPKTFWDEACLIACYLLNRLLTPLMKNKSLIEKLFARTPNYGCVWDCDFIDKKCDFKSNRKK